MRMKCTFSKAIIFLCFLFGLLFVNSIYAQSVPYGFSYQAIVRDGLGLPVVNSSTTLRLTLLQGGPTGTVLWQESHTATTNQFGLVNLVVGAGTREAGSATLFSDINWSAGQTFIRVELLQGSNIINLGTAPFQSVPYALASENSLRIQNIRVSSTAPTNGQFLTYNAITGFWEPQNVAGANGGTVISVSGIGPIQVTGNGGLDPVIGILQSSDIQDGYLSATDWSSFSNKIAPTTVVSVGGDVLGSYASGFTVTGLQGRSVSSVAPVSGSFLVWDNVALEWRPSSVAAGTVFTVTGLSPLTVNNGGTSPQISISQASATTDGYLTSTDWAMFNSKLDINSVAGGDLSGTYSNLTVNRIRNQLVSPTAPTLGQILKWDGTQWAPSPLTISGLIATITGSFPVEVSGTSDTPHIIVYTVTNVSDGVLKASDYVSFLNKLGPTDVFGGDVTGTYANLTVGSITGVPVNAAGVLTNQVLMFNGTSFVPQNIPTTTQTTLTGVNGITVSGSGFSYTIGGENLVFNTNVVSGDLTGNILTPLIADNAVTIPKLASGILTTLTGLNGVTINQSGQAFSIIGNALGVQYGNLSAGDRPIVILNSDNSITSTGLNINNNKLILGGSDILLSNSADSNHGLGIYNSSKLYLTQDINGPVIYGNGGGALGINNAGVPSRIVLNWLNNGSVGINNNVITDITATLDVNGNIRVRNLSVTGSVITVDGLGNLGLGSVASSQWSNGTEGIFYSGGKIGLGTNAPQANLQVVSSVPGLAAFITAANNDLSNYINLYSGNTGYPRSSIAWRQGTDITFGVINGITNEASFAEYMRISSIGNLGIGTQTPNQKITVEGNASIVGTVFAQNLNLNGLSNGLLSVNGLGDLVIGPAIATLFQSTTPGTSFTSDNIAIGTSTVGGAKLRVAGDISGGGLVVASSTMHPTGTASLTYKTLYRQRIYIPSGTIFIDGSINVYKYLPSGLGTLEIAVGPQTVIVAASTDNPNASETIPPINVSALAGTFQTLEIRGVVDMLAEGIVVSGYVLKTRD